MSASEFISPESGFIFLSTEERANPYKFIEEFFSAAWLPDHLRLLKQWRDAAAFGRQKKKASPSNLLYQYELTMKLLEAAWLLKDEKPGKTGIKKTQKDVADWFIKNESDRLEHYPRNLKTKEIIRPARVLKDVFRSYTLVEYRQTLRDWLYDAVSEKFMEESLTKAEVLQVYEQVVKLYEGMWLVSARNITPA